MSACLAGVNCRYDGGNNLYLECLDLVRNNKVLLFCPEGASDLGCPRFPAEIAGTGGGAGVWEGSARVIDVRGRDVTGEFQRGARASLEMILSHTDVEMVILKSRSPSCGVGFIYDGSFRGQLVAGDGVTTALLKKHGLKTLDVEEYLKERN